MTSNEPSRLIVDRTLVHNDDPFAESLTDLGPVLVRTMFRVRLLGNPADPADPASRPGASFSVREYRAYRRASGKTFYTWEPQANVSVRRTRAGLLVIRRGNPKGGAYADHLWREDLLYGLTSKLALAEADLPNAVHVVCRRLGLDLVEILDQVAAHVGPRPHYAQRVPLLADTMLEPENRRRSDDIRVIERGGLTEWVDAADAKEVAMRLFGKKAYRRPMAAPVLALERELLQTVAVFRGLVPAEAIIELLQDLMAVEDRHHRTGCAMNHADRRALRSVLRELPEPLRKRLIKQFMVNGHPMFDLVRLAKASDLSMLSELVALRGHRNIRSWVDLENLVRRLPPSAAHRRLLARGLRSERACRVHEAERRRVAELRGINAALSALHRPQVGLAQWHDDPALRERLRAEHPDTRAQAWARVQQENARRAAEEQEKRAAREKENAAWAAELGPRLHGRRLAGYRLEVAHGAEQLARWSAAMSNCIGQTWSGYADRIGLDLLCALVDDGGNRDSDRDGDGAAERMVVNLEITRTEGLRQILGKHNVTLVRAIGEEKALSVINGLLEHGVLIEGCVHGLHGLKFQPDRLPA